MIPDCCSLQHIGPFVGWCLRCGLSGGWQDQVGGVYPGIKSSTTAPGVPCSVSVRGIGDAPCRFVDLLNDHLLLVYTGVTRLAANILEQVLRSVVARLPQLSTRVGWRLKVSWLVWYDETGDGCYRTGTCGTPCWYETVGLMVSFSFQVVIKPNCCCHLFPLSATATQRRGLRRPH